MISKPRIDALLMSHIGRAWRKAAMVVGTTLVEHRAELQGTDDSTLLRHLQGLVLAGHVEAQGDLSNMRFSEVRIAAGTGV